MNLSGQTAVITGGGSGVGRAIAGALAAEGVNVVLASRRLDLLLREAETINTAGGGEAVAVQCDLRNRESITALARSAEDRFGAVDILVNNSGLGVDTRLVDCSEADWDLVMDTNLKGAFLLTQALLPGMIERRSGFILNIASQAAKHGYANAGPYCASKFGLVGFAEALQQEVREFGIRVHSLCPALIQVPPPEGDETPRDGVLHVEDLAATALFLLQQPARVKFENIGLYHL